MKTAQSLLLALCLVAATSLPATAATVSLGDAAEAWAAACRADVEKHCKSVNPVGGELAACLAQNGTPVCNAATVAFAANLDARLAAGAQAKQICRSDTQRFCSNFDQGSARVLRCLMQPQHFKAASVPCKDTLAAAGWLDTISIRTQHQDPLVANSIEQLGKSVQKVEIDVVAVRQDLIVRIKAEGGEDASASAAELAALDQLPNFDAQIEFFLNSDVVKPESWVTLGSMADALHHPLLAGDRFLVVGHTDSTGGRTQNLDLSDRRAAAIAAILNSTFKVPAAHLVPLGVGEEQQLPGVPPTDPRNRRVQLINLGAS